MDKLIYTDVPAVMLASNTYIRVPTILQIDDTPLIEVVNAQTAGFTARIPIYYSDGTYLAKIVGSRIVLTDARMKVS